MGCAFELRLFSLDLDTDALKKNLDQVSILDPDSHYEGLKYKN